LAVIVLVSFGMNISKTKFRPAYVPTTALAKSLSFDSEMMHVTFAGLMAGVDWRAA
jgi:hypothetical protein